MAAIESNITNASNPNYSAESVTLQAQSSYEGAGGGVQVLGTVRAEAPYLTSQINSTQSSDSYNQEFSQITTLAQQILAPSSGGLSDAMQSMFNALTNLSASPQDPTARSTAIASLSQFAQSDQTISSGLSSIVDGQTSQIQSVVAQINQASSQIAQLNGQIIAAGASGSSAPALQDQRDALVNQLAGLIGASADANGNVSVGGVPLVSGTSALTLSTTGSGPTLGLEVSLSNGNLPIDTSQLGGTLGGLLAGVASVQQLQSNVDTLSSNIASAMNTQASSGYGLDGSTGTALFTISAGGPIALNPALNTQNLEAAASAGGVPGDGSNAAALAALANSQNLIPSMPNSTPVQAFANISANFGTVVQNATNEQQQSATSLQSLTSLKGSITGVSLNEQLVQLVQYQNMLQASGRAVQAVNDMMSFLVQQLSS